MVRMSRTAALVCAVLFLFFGVSTAFAQHAANSPNDGVNNGQQAAANSPGHLRQATREEQAELAALSTNLSQSTEGLVVVTRGDGSQTVDLQDRFQDAMLVRMGTDGELEEKCTNDFNDAVKFMNGETPAAKPTVELETK